MIGVVPYMQAYESILQDLQLITNNTLVHDNILFAFVPFTEKQYTESDGILVKTRYIFILTWFRFSILMSIQRCWWDMCNKIEWDTEEYRKQHLQWQSQAIYTEVDVGRRGIQGLWWDFGRIRESKEIGKRDMITYHNLNLSFTAWFDLVHGIKSKHTKFHRKAKF